LSSILASLRIEKRIEFCECFALLGAYILKQVAKRGILNLRCKIRAAFFVFFSVIEGVFDIKKFFG
jgi:hypothetical protein